MCDTFHPLRLSTLARDLDDGKYALLLVRDGRRGTVGRGPHLAPLALRLVLDWDGTVTVRDSLVQVIESSAIPRLLRELEPRVGVDLTLHEEIALEFAAREGTARRGRRLGARARRGAAGAPRARAHGTRPVVISAGFRELIAPVLAREGVELDVLANRSTHVRTAGACAFATRLRVRRAASRASAAASPASRTSTSATATPTAAPRSPPIGSSRATGSPRYLDEQGVAYEPFDDLNDVVAALERQPLEEVVDRL